MLEFAKKMHPKGADVTLNEMIDLASEADEDVLRAMHASKVPMCYATVGEGETTRTPWGWICCEMVQGTDVCAGYRWGCCSDMMTPGFAELGLMMLPRTGSVKANSTLSLLSKIFTAFEEMHGAGTMTAGASGVAITKFIKVRHEGSSAAPVKKSRSAPALAAGAAPAPKKARAGKGGD